MLCSPSEEFFLREFRRIRVIGGKNPSCKECPKYDVEKTQNEDIGRERQKSHHDETLEIVENCPFADNGGSERFGETYASVSVLFPPQVIEAFGHAFPDEAISKGIFERMIHGDGQNHNKHELPAVYPGSLTELECLKLMGHRVA